MTTTIPLTLAALDTLPEREACALLESCCGSREWVRQMAAARPYREVDDMLYCASDCPSFRINSPSK